jgi:NADP-dependent 3-hydroxy acid dehydrogenase YdfG
MMRIALKPLAEQVVVITGASSGIGLVTAKMLAARGATVMLVARNEEALASTVDAIVAAGGTAAFAVADVADRDALERAAAETITRFGRIDTWVNDAGVAIYAKLVDTPPEEHQRLFATNYFGVVNGSLTAIPHLRGGGALITVASIGADLPTPVIGAYAASKHAVKAYIETVRMELHADRVPIAVTLIKPSGIDTTIGQHAANHGFGAIQGEALVPPPVYAPELVAQAICHAAEHVRRLLDWITPGLAAKVFDPSQARTPENSLFESSDAGRERSGDESPRRFSAYTAAVLHPRATAGIVLCAAAGAAFLLRRQRSASSSQGALPQ